MAIKPLQKSSLVDEVATAIREHISDGDFQPGETLRIEALAREFGVSRTPIREAFSKLEAEGLLVRRAGYSATIFTPTRAEVCEYYEMRIVLEPLAARLALPNMTPVIERRLDALLRKMDETTVPSWYALNREFHRGLYEPSGRALLVATITNLIDRSDPYLRIYFQSHDYADSRRAHREIVAAVGARDEHAVVRAVEDHLGRALSSIIEAIPEETE
jgi:DNA-binding GntR family transcriptional regulator